MVDLSVSYRRFLRSAATLAAVILAQSALPAPLVQSTSAEIAATFVSDVTIPDGTVVEPGEGFTKTWRVKNSGSVPWNEYKLKFSSGDQMGAPDTVVVPLAAPGAVVDIDVPMITPTEAGRHEGIWHIHTTDGEELRGVHCQFLSLLKGPRRWLNWRPVSEIVPLRCARRPSKPWQGSGRRLFQG